MYGTLGRRANVAFDRPNMPLVATVRTFVTLALLIPLYACRDAEPVTKPPAPPAPVTVATPVERNVVEWAYYTGRTEAAHTVELRARVSGYLERIAFEPGKIVDKGDLLFVIDQRPYRAALAHTEAELKRARIELRGRETSLKRAEGLIKQNMIPDEEYDRRRIQRGVSSANVLAAEAALASAKLDMEFTEIHAPIRGRISRNFVDEGNLVVGGDQAATLLATLVSIDPIFVYVDADERSIIKYQEMHRQGERISARYARIPAEVGLSTDVGYPWQGTVDYMAPTADASTGTLRARIVIPNPDDFLKGGFFARIRVAGSAEYPAILITDRAVLRDQGQKFVWVVDADKVAHYRQIEVGPRIDGLRVVRSGLVSSDQVVINGIHRVRDGVVVAPEPGEMTPSQDELAQISPTTP